jgi:aryl-alcohol dehydrogenase-like predicted oxidoreductase
VRIESKPLGSTGLSVSDVAMGCVKLGRVSSLHGRRAGVRLVHAALDSGIRLFDTADAYGSGVSESVLGDALHGSAAEAAVATKVGYLFTERTASAQIARGLATSVTRRLPGGRRRATEPYARQDFSAAYVRQAVGGSLRRLRVDRIDLLQFHGPPPAPSDGLPPVVRELLDEGVIGAFGIGSESLDVASSWIEVEGVSAVQLAVGVLDPQAVDGVIPRARALGIGIMARGVLGGGLLARRERGQPTGLDPHRSARLDRIDECASRYGADLMQAAIWYGRHRVGADTVVLGISSTEQLAGVMRMVTRDPPEGLLAELTRIVEGDR